MECGNIVTIFFKCSSAEKPNHGHDWLLRARRNRPSSCTAKKGDELAPSHVPSVKLRTGHRIASNEQTGRGRVLRTADVRFGSLADSCTATTHVRFTPESGHQPKNDNSNRSFHNASIGESRPRRH